MALIIIPYLKEMDSSSLGTKLGLDYDVLSPDKRDDLIFGGFSHSNLVSFCYYIYAIT